ncbi:MAG: hypothetical protein EOO50_01630 [Flavobacterium sp.]|uniref:hypothetical protein n=1 Tax=Flavobacterium sp. TaxID=239 RepID=UPI00120E2B3E|nr:hypothetical protein [Flavobacterium sp.]RZJ68518.1 MAG: hypothetical protein EOO50_01630 [Flavobacterium sp.]
MKKILLLCIAGSALLSCGGVKHKENILDSNDWGVNDNSLKMDGYYYQELDGKIFRNEYTGFSQDETKDRQHAIKPFLLYADGSVLTTGALIGTREKGSFDHHKECGLTDGNTIRNAKKFFECDLSHYEDAAPIWDRGIYKAGSGTITIQYYVNLDEKHFLVEKKGEIINDSLFVLKTKFDFELKVLTNINEEYKFQPFENVPKSSNPLVEQRHKYSKAGR